MSKPLISIAGGFGVVGFVAIICLVLFSISVSLYGLYLAFSASIILGFLALMVEPSPLVFGLAMLFFENNIPETIVNYLSN